MAKKDKEVTDQVIKMMRSAKNSALKSSGLSQIFLKRENFASNAVSTGSVWLDYKIGGGIPPGRIVGISGPEHSGKSLFVTEILRAQLEANRFAEYFDAEGGTDPLFLKARGINFEEYLGSRDKNGSLKPEEVDHIGYYQPTTGEEVVKHVHSLLTNMPENRSHTPPPVIFALDSVVALISESVSEDIDANRIAMHARMYSENMPIIQGLLSKTGCSFVYVNQLRQKPGVQYGCIQGDCMIQFVDGRTFPLREVVENKIEGEVWSYVNGEIKPAKIKNWYNNGKSRQDDWIKIKTDGPGSGNGFYSVTCTKDHKLLCGNEWVKAKDLVVGDKLTTKYIETIEPKSIAEQFIIGCLIGDSCIPKKQRNKDIMVLTNNEQPGYLDWKLSKLEKVLEFKKHFINATTKSPYYQYISKPDICLGLLADKLQNRSPKNILDKLSWLSIAVWYMDDGSADFSDYHCRGSISIKRLKNDFESLEAIQSWFRRYDIEVSLSDPTKIIFNKDSFLKLCDNIARFIPECMWYKLPLSHHHRYDDFQLAVGRKSMPLPINIIEISHGLGNRSSDKYDLEVEGSHNYLVGHSRGGIIVHNSPEYEPAGDSLKFFSAIRLRLKGNKPKLLGNDHPFIDGAYNPKVTPKAGGIYIESHLENGVKVGEDRAIYTAITSIKNKVYTPQQVCWVRIVFDECGSTGRGLDPAFDTFSFLYELGMLAKAKPNKEKNEKKADVAGLFEVPVSSKHDLKKLIDFPWDAGERFSYHDYKNWAWNAPGIIKKVRDVFLVTGLAYELEVASEEKEEIPLPVNGIPVPPISE